MPRSCGCKTSPHHPSYTTVLDSWYVFHILCWHFSLVFEERKPIYLSNLNWWYGNTWEQTINLNTSHYLKCFLMSVFCYSASYQISLKFCRLCVLWAPVTVITRSHTHTPTVWSVTIVSGLIFSSIQPATLDTVRIHTCTHRHTSTQTFLTCTKTHTHITKVFISFSCYKTDVSGESLQGEDKSAGWWRACYNLICVSVCAWARSFFVPPGCTNCTVNPPYITSC